VPAKEKLDRGVADRADAIAFADALTVILCQEAGTVGLPVQVHVGLIWSAGGPTRIPEIMDLTPLFHICPRTTFVIFHGGYPRTDDLAHVAATMSNVRAEFNWVPFWSGMDFARLIGKWIDMVPNDRILYGTDAGGFVVSSTHDVITREGLAEALSLRIQRGYLSRRVALEIAANILRNNAIGTYPLDLGAYHP
jgi:predicted TIM-barrel fold metal-dependent hydrolase